MKPAKNVIPITSGNSPMTTNLPEPPVEPDFSLAGYTSFLFDTQRFLNSEFVLSSDPAAIGLGVILWAVAWQQIPCGSLPDDDVRAVGLGHRRGISACSIALRDRDGRDRRGNFCA